MRQTLKMWGLVFLVCFVTLPVNSSVCSKQASQKTLQLFSLFGRLNLFAMQLQSRTADLGIDNQPVGNILKTHLTKLQKLAFGGSWQSTNNQTQKAKNSAQNWLRLIIEAEEHLGHIELILESLERVHRYEAKKSPQTAKQLAALQYLQQQQLVARKMLAAVVSFKESLFVSEVYVDNAGNGAIINTELEFSSVAAKHNFAANKCYQYDPNKFKFCAADALKFINEDGPNMPAANKDELLKHGIVNQSSSVQKIANKNAELALKPTEYRVGVNIKDTSDSTPANNSFGPKIKVDFNDPRSWSEVTPSASNIYKLQLMQAQQAFVDSMPLAPTILSQLVQKDWENLFKHSVDTVGKTFECNAILSSMHNFSWADFYIGYKKGYGDAKQEGQALQQTLEQERQQFATEKTELLNAKKQQLATTCVALEKMEVYKQELQQLTKINHELVANNKTLGQQCAAANAKNTTLEQQINLLTKEKKQLLASNQKIKALLAGILQQQMSARPAVVAEQPNDQPIFVIDSFEQKQMQLEMQALAAEKQQLQQKLNDFEAEMQNIKKMQASHEKHVAEINNLEKIIECQGQEKEIAERKVQFLETLLLSLLDEQKAVNQWAEDRKKA